MRRAFLIARREYLSFLRTPGFWISLLVMPLAGSTAIIGPQWVARSEPPPRLAVLDLTHPAVGGSINSPSAYLATKLAEAQRTASGSAGDKPILLVSPPADIAKATTPEAAGAAARAYLTGAKALADGQKLTAVAVMFGDTAHLKIDLWTPTPEIGLLSGRLSEPLNIWLREARLAEAGVGPDLALRLDQNLVEVRNFSPKAASGRVALRDRLPAIAAVILSVLLWTLTMTGAGVLLNTVIEEKANRVMEVLLSSASVSEILSGKILGAGALALTMLSIWGGGTAYFLSKASPDVAQGVVAALMSHGLIFWFAAFFVTGYLMYASIFAAIGSFCETPRDAQTLLGPVMVVLTIPLIFLGASIGHPDAAIIRTLAWVPPFTPFLMSVRVAAGASVWELGAALVMMALTAVGVMILAGRAFRSGALASEKPDLKRWVARLMRR